VTRRAATLFLLLAGLPGGVAGAQVRLMVEGPSNGFDIEAATAEREVVVRRVLTLLGDAAPTDTQVHIQAYLSLEEKADATGNERWGHLEPATEVVHAAITPEVRGDRMGLEAPLLFRRALGNPRLAVLEIGLASFYSSGWGGTGFEYWAARLHAGGMVPPLAAILSPEWSAQTSPLIVQPVAGALVAYLLNRWSRTGFMDRYASWSPSDEEVAGLEAGWSYYLDGLLRRHGVAIESDIATRRARRSAGPHELRGVNFAHEGYRRFDGYLSDRSDQSLGRLRELGANAVAIVPYTFMPDPERPTPLRRPLRRGSETDEAVTRAIRSAQAEGLTVLLKPHVWLQGSWPGEISMRSRGDWDEFFDSYEAWILHYALMAEMHDVALLSVGVELSLATRGREQRWEEMVRRIRSIYSGSLVYAANWGEEFEGLEFWDVFDYLGIDAYYPLSEDPEASDEELLRGAEAMLDRIERVQNRYRKPVLFTEIGFASAKGAWIRPWEGHLVREASQEDQLRSYRAVIGAMERRPWIGGVFWWEWPSDLRRSARDARGFMPAGKQVEALLDEWFDGLGSSSEAF
jgi:hypothetical protein